MKITYLNHSGFYVELDSCSLLFDYYKGDWSNRNADKPLYIFVSHRHPDHYNKDVFDLTDNCESVTYILSKDISKRGIKEDKKTIFVKADQILDFGDIQVETLKSTDEGVAFLVTCEGKCIYHAGDLNWWCWPDDTEKEHDEMTNKFLNEMEKVQGRHFDVAFLPLDPRQEEMFYWGFDYFMRVTDTDMVYPMHCWDDYSVVDRLINMDTSSDYRDRIQRVENITIK